MPNSFGLPKDVAERLSAGVARIRQKDCGQKESRRIDDRFEVRGSISREVVEEVLPVMMIGLGSVNGKK